MKAGVPLVSLMPYYCMPVPADGLAAALTKKKKATRRERRGSQKERKTGKESKGRIWLWLVLGKIHQQAHMWFISRAVRWIIRNKNKWQPDFPSTDISVHARHAFVSLSVIVSPSQESAHWSSISFLQWMDNASWQLMYNRGKWGLYIDLNMDLHKAIP